jgi:prepilin-type N-terminal cleavage/methylation domain-containing protein
VQKSRSRKAFSLIELLVVIAVIAIIASVGFGYMYGVNKAAKAAVDRQNAKIWNTAYVNVVAVEYTLDDGKATAFSSLGWSDASHALATGVAIKQSDGSSYTIKADTPSFSDAAVTQSFVPGKGLTGSIIDSQ